MLEFMKTQRRRAHDSDAVIEEADRILNGTFRIRLDDCHCSQTQRRARHNAVLAQVSRLAQGRMCELRFDYHYMEVNLGPPDAEGPLTAMLEAVSPYVCTICNDVY